MVKQSWVKCVTLHELVCFDGPSSARQHSIHYVNISRGLMLSLASFKMTIKQKSSWSKSSQATPNAGDAGHPRPAVRHYYWPSLKKSWKTQSSRTRTAFQTTLAVALDLSFESWQLVIYCPALYTASSLHRRRQIGKSYYSRRAVSISQGRARSTEAWEGNRQLGKLGCLKQAV